MRLEKMLNTLLTEYKIASIEGNALARLAEKYEVSEQEMWNFLLASRKFLEAGRNQDEE